MKVLFEKLKKYKGNILLLIFSLGLTNFLIWSGSLQINVIFSTSDHFNIITINSVLAGFLFTGLGIMVSGLSKDRIQRLEENGYLDKYYLAIYIAIFFNIISIFVAILLIFNKVSRYIFLFSYVEQVSLIISILFFIKCMNNLRKIINRMRKSS